MFPHRGCSHTVCLRPAASSPFPSARLLTTPCAPAWLPCSTPSRRGVSEGGTHQQGDGPARGEVWPPGVLLAGLFGQEGRAGGCTRGALAGGCSARTCARAGRPGTGQSDVLHCPDGGPQFHRPVCSRAPPADAGLAAPRRSCHRTPLHAGVAVPPLARSSPPPRRGSTCSPSPPLRTRRSTPRWRRRLPSPLRCACALLALLARLLLACTPASCFARPWQAYCISLPWLDAWLF